MSPARLALYSSAYHETIPDKHGSICSFLESSGYPHPNPNLLGWMWSRKTLSTWHVLSTLASLTQEACLLVSSVAQEHLFSSLHKSEVLGNVTCFKEKVRIYEKYPCFKEWSTLQSVRLLKWRCSKYMIILNSIQTYSSCFCFHPDF